MGTQDEFDMNLIWVYTESEMPFIRVQTIALFSFVNTDMGAIRRPFIGAYNIIDISQGTRNA